MAESDGLSTDSKMAGSPMYAAPELLHPVETDGTRTPESDVFAFGILIAVVNTFSDMLLRIFITLLSSFYQLFAGEDPFKLPNRFPGALILAIIHGTRPTRPSHLDPTVWSVAEQCWQHNWLQRPNIRTLLQHDLFRPYLASDPSGEIVSFGPATLTKSLLSLPQPSPSQEEQLHSRALFYPLNTLPSLPQGTAYALCPVCQGIFKIVVCIPMKPNLLILPR